MLAFGNSEAFGRGHGRCLAAVSAQAQRLGRSTAQQNELRPGLVSQRWFAGCTALPVRQNGHAALGAAASAAGHSPPAEQRGSPVRPLRPHGSSVPGRPLAAPRTATSGPDTTGASDPGPVRAPPPRCRRR